MTSHRMFAALLFTATLLAAGPRAFGETHYPPGVPNLADPGLLAQFIPLSISRLAEDPDFPVLLLANRGEGSPQFILVIVDARNGKETWSLREDAPVFYVLFNDLTTIHQAFLDEGFASRGTPSGHFIAAGPEAAGELLARLRARQDLSRGPGRPGQSI